MKQVRIALATLLLLLIEGHSIAWQVTVPGAEERAAFLAAYPNATITWHRYSGETTMVSGVQIKGFQGAPVDVGQSVLLEFRTLLGLPEKNISFVPGAQRETRAGGRRMLFHTHSDGVELPGDDFLIGVNRPFEGDRFYIDQDGNVAPPGYFFQTLGERRDYDEPRADWYVYFIQRVKHASVDSYADETDRGNTDSELAGIEASRGVSSSCPQDDYSFVGSAFAYRTNPLNDDLQTVSLNNLCKQSPVTLSGKQVHVESWVGQGTGEVISTPDGVFTFHPDSSEFEDVSVYYHIDSYLSMMRDRGFDPLIGSDYSLNAYVRSTETSTAVSRYKTGKIDFGVPDSAFENAALEAATIAHETTHNLQYDFLTASYLGVIEKEHTEMGEAYADYLGLVYRSFQLGHYRPWEQPVIGNFLSPELTHDLPRDLSSPEPHYSGRGKTNYAGIAGTPTSINLYDNSLIFSTALMDFDRTDGSLHSSAFVIESLFNISGTPDFHKGRDALMLAANNCALGADPQVTVCCESQLCSQKAGFAFAKRGIGEADILESRAGAADRGTLFPENPVLLEGNFPNPFSSRTRIEFEVIRPVRVRVNVYDALGRQVEQLLDTHLPRGRHFIDWLPSDTADGAYFFEIVADDFAERGSMLLIR